MKNLKGKVAAITGAGSGIGQALALEMAQEGCNLALSDINETGLQDTVNQTSKFGVRVTQQCLNVADREAVKSWAAQVHKDHKQINIIINNAGVGLSATVEDMSLEDFEWLMNINFWGVVYGTKAFLPYLQQADEGHILNISSIFGIIAVPTQSAYNASKFAVRGFTESLRQELEMAHSHVSCSSIHPGGIKTNIAKNSRLVPNDILPMDQDTLSEAFDSMAYTTPAEAASSIVKGLKHNNRRVLIGPDANIIDLLQRLLPTRHQKIVPYILKNNLNLKKFATKAITGKDIT